MAQSRGLVPPRIKPSSISVARSRLSWPLFKHLQEVACQPLAHDTHMPPSLLSRTARDGD